MKNVSLSLLDNDRIIEMAWEDHTTFEAIAIQFGLSEKEVIVLMPKNIKTSSFKIWRQRTNGRTTKHAALKKDNISRFKCARQRTISCHKISKR